MHDEYNHTPPYFGNDSQQTRIIMALEKAAERKKSGLHLVTGGPASGKSNALEIMRAGLSRHYTELADPMRPLPDGLPPSLGKLLRAMEDEDSKIYVQHYLYKAKTPTASGRDCYLVVADGETPLTDRHAMDMVKRIANEVADKTKPYELVWVADVPVRLQSVPLFKPNGSAAHELEKHKKGVALLEAEYGKHLAVHALKYDAREAAEGLWDAIRKDGRPFIHSFNETTHCPTDAADKAQWQKACDAAQEGDRKAYGSAMRVLQANAKSLRAING